MHPRHSSSCLVTATGLRAVVLLTAVLVQACVSGGGPPSSVGIAPESVWLSLNRPRPEPLASAPRVSVTDLILVGTELLGESAVSPSIGLQELVAAGLIRRRDVRFVERRRFVAAVEREARRCSQVPNADSPLKVGNFCQARMKTFWVRSSATSSPAMRLARL